MGRKDYSQHQPQGMKVDERAYNCEQDTNAATNFRKVVKHTPCLPSHVHPTPFQPHGHYPKLTI